jgi:flavin reductase (DIM6/NTAB) family NADH-FMN oxidoreductase RutF
VIEEMNEGPVELASLDPGFPLWDRVFTVSPLVVVGTREGEGYDLAPKHMAVPLGWGNHFGFVCTPRHSTYRNVARTGEFTVSFPRPSQVVLAALAASPREGWSGRKPGLATLPTRPAEKVTGVFLADSYFFLECRLSRIVDGFGENSLVAGTVVAAHAHPDAVRISDEEEGEAVRRVPLLVYLDPGRFAVVEDSRSFPWPAGLLK